MQTTYTKFNVSDVAIEKASFPASTLEELFKCKSDNNTHKIEATSQHQTPLHGGSRNGLFSAIHYAYDKHIGLELEPDHFKLLILQGFSIHVNENSEKFRKLFVNHEGKKTITVRRDDFIRGSPLNPWQEIFGQFASKIENDLLDKDLVRLVQQPLTSTTPISMASFNISLMETMQQYFEYRMMTCCGIPFINLKGTVDDWTSLLALVDHIEQYELSWWTNKIRPLLEKIVQTVSTPDAIDVDFWKDIIKKNGGSGGPYYNGWICKFFPYIGTNEYRKNTFESITDVPTGISSVPVTWEYYQVEYKMQFTTGFYGFSYQNDTIKPEISWIVYENGTQSPKQNARPTFTNRISSPFTFTQQIKDTYTRGTFYSESKDCYPTFSGVRCDYCSQSVDKKDPCLHLDNCDLCLGCISKVKDVILKK